MIAFACSHCGTKLNVKPEFAGRQSKCPTCKQPLVVPMPSATVPFVPPQQIDGQESSLVRAGLDAGVTLPPHDTSKLGATPGKPLARDPLAGRKNSRERYVIEGEIARGGMGAVLRAVDRDLRREIAVKYMLDAKDPKKQARFVEEAQINSQLEHPNIVPVYDLGIDAQKRPFIMMKMVKGRSLKEVLDQLRDNPKQAEKEWSLGRLLNILVGVCNALAFAHSRGVIHRDLKPANIMLGDFGEVYVMDWGLAKVLSHDGQAVAAAAEPTINYEPGRQVPTSRSSKVVTSREPEADLTQEGAVVGTPVYMPPEQATGQVNAIDQRSDVYSLGAILYEMLTLQPPVAKEGGHLSVLMQVAQGEIVPPEIRDPKRARAGKIPRELSAVAMRAMAKEKAGRYPTAEALRQDIERFQEGRSVSAKEDTKTELLWKFVKRNKGFSAGMAAALLVLLCSLVFIGIAWFKTNKAYLDYQDAQNEKQRRTKEAVPVFVAAARMWGDARNPGNALIQVNMALDYDPADASAYLLKGQVLVAQKNFKGAGEVLDHYLTLQPKDADARELRQLCHEAKADDGERLLALAGVLLRQKAPGLSDCLMQDVSKLIQAREKLLAVLQMRIDAAWPGLGNRLKVPKDGRLTLEFWSCGSQVRDLSPLRGMPLDALFLNACGQVRDLTPLKGMPLTFLDLGSCTEVRDLAQLQGMPLTQLSLWQCDKVRDLKPLQGMKLTSLNLRECFEVRDLTPLKGMPLTFLDLGSCTEVRDLAPLQGMPLTQLSVGGCKNIRDLSPLQGMPLTSLNLMYCNEIHDLTPLQGMKLAYLAVPNQITDKDLTRLQGMKITSLEFSFCNDVQDLRPLQGMRLSSLTLAACNQARDLTPLQGVPLTSLYLIGSGQVSDLTPLRGMELQELYFDPRKITKGMDIIRQMKSLKTVGIEWHRNQQMPAAEFWKKYDAGEFK